MRDVTLEQEEVVAETSATAEDDCVAREEIEERPPERNMGAQSSRIALKVMTRVELFVDERKLGKTFGTDCGYLLPPDAAKKVRFPDGSFVARGRLPDDRSPEGHVKLAPDLALEVVSPNDTAFEIEEKRVAYLRGGVRLLWIVYPPTRTVFVF